MESLRHLCCGQITPSHSRIHDILNILGEVIERYGKRACELTINGTDEDKTMLGSFLARKVLESASSALLARMDPGRLLILQEYQQRAGTNYNLNDRHPASIAWTGDIIPAEKAGNNLWVTEIPPDKFVRSLLGGHLAEIAWPRAIKRFSEQYDSNPQSGWLEDLSEICERNRDEHGALNTVKVLAVFRSKAMGIFSSLSKGVHLEFMIDERMILDSATVEENIKATIKMVSQLGYLSNHIDCMFTGIEDSYAAELIMDIETQIEMQS